MLRNIQQRAKRRKDWHRQNRECRGTWNQGVEDGLFPKNSDCRKRRRRCGQKLLEPINNRVGNNALVHNHSNGRGYAAQKSTDHQIPHARIYVIANLLSSLAGNDGCDDTDREKKAADRLKAKIH